MWPRPPPGALPRAAAPTLFSPPTPTSSDGREPVQLDEILLHGGPAAEGQHVTGRRPAEKERQRAHQGIDAGAEILARREVGVPLVEHGDELDLVDPLEIAEAD